MEQDKKEERSLFRSIIDWFKQRLSIGNSENQIVIRLSMGSTRVLITATVGDGVISDEVLTRMLSVLTEYNKITSKSDRKDNSQKADPS